MDKEILIKNIKPSIKLINDEFYRKFDISEFEISIKTCKQILNDICFTEEYWNLFGNRDSISISRLCEISEEYNHQIDSTGFGCLYFSEYNTFVTIDNMGNYYITYIVDNENIETFYNVFIDGNFDSENFVFLGNSNYYFGIELEYENIFSHNAYEIVRKYEFLNSETADSSLKYGREFVFNPMSIDYIEKHKSEIADFIDDLINESAVTESHCGMHVHISRKAFSKTDLLKFQWFFYNNIYETEILSSRTDLSLLDKYASLEADYSYIQEKANGYSGNKFDAINTQHEKTIEVRIFASTLDVNILISRLYMLHELIQFVKITDIADINYFNFYNFTNNKEVKELLSDIIHYDNFKKKVLEIVAAGEFSNLLVAYEADVYTDQKIVEAVNTAYNYYESLIYDENCITEQFSVDEYNQIATNINDNELLVAMQSVSDKLKLNIRVSEIKKKLNDKHEKIDNINDIIKKIKNNNRLKILLKRLDTTNFNKEFIDFLINFHNKKSRKLINSLNKFSFDKFDIKLIKGFVIKHDIDIVYNKMKLYSDIASRLSKISKNNKNYSNAFAIVVNHIKMEEQHE